MGGGDPGEVCEEDGVHDRAIQQLLHQQHHGQWDRYTGERGERERGDITGTPASNRNNQNHRTVVLRPHLFISMTKLCRPDTGQREQMTFQLDN